ncbi:hypothetical protein [Streptomyces sp. Tue6028]|uniref:hypothetical protein n=1 Tax=Streptomyces sp. Tue6028 TaxID=2036037 RepID=UPI003EC10EB3
MDPGTSRRLHPFQRPVTHAPRQWLAITAARAGTVRAAYVKGRSIAALARDHGVSRGAIRTVIDGLPDQAVTKETAAPELPVTLDLPVKAADFLPTSELEPAERVALDQGVTVRARRKYENRVGTLTH